MQLKNTKLRNLVAFEQIGRFVFGLGRRRYEQDIKIGSPKILHAYPWIRPTIMSVRFKPWRPRHIHGKGLLMLNVTTFVGLDVYARKIQAVALDAMTGEVRSATFKYDAAAVAEWVRSIDPEARCVYESGVTGFDLQKKLAALGVDCVIGAVSKMIKPAADRGRKNDRNDAEFLARMLSVGNVVEVWVPDDGCEAARDLARALAVSATVKTTISTNVN